MSAGNANDSYSSDVVIAGAGWAGLAAAVELAREGIKVSVLESAKQVGGRARTISFNNMAVDNGEHMLIGAYSDVLRMLRVMGIAEQDVLRRIDLSLHVRDENARHVSMKAPRLPAPLHLGAGLLAMRDIPLRERLANLRFTHRLWRSGFGLEQDTSVADLLKRHKVPDSIQRFLWEPLCIATLNTPLASASARVFLRVLRDSFSRKRSDGDLLLPNTDMGNILPKPAVAYVEAHGGHVYLATRARELAFEDGELAGLHGGGRLHKARHTILALSPHETARLTRDTRLHALSDQLTALGQQPICTVYLRYPEHVRLEPELLGLTGYTTQWLVDRGPRGQAGLIAAVISAQGAHMDAPAEQLARDVAAEVAALFPDWPAPLSMKAIREKRATFDCSTGVDERRPGNATAVPNLWLAGDYTDTGYPATLEGAVRSGVQCARAIRRRL